MSHHTQGQQAYLRGQKAAGIYRRIKATALGWDRKCVHLARQYKLPHWVGHLPITGLIIFSISACLAAGFLFVITAILVWAFLLIPTIRERLASTVNVTNCQEQSHHYKDGSNGSNGSDGSAGS